MFWGLCIHLRNWSSGVFSFVHWWLTWVDWERNKNGDIAVVLKLESEEDVVCVYPRDGLCACRGLTLAFPCKRPLHGAAVDALRAFELSGTS